MRAVFTHLRNRHILTMLRLYARHTTTLLPAPFALTGTEIAR
ncbi:hypothetical protein [Streptomyces sp. JH14]|nr:hypothetical protein [Streptomyces sp. JH14]